MTSIKKSIRHDWRLVAAIIVLTALLLLAWSTIWKRQAEARSIRAQLATARADAADHRAELDEIRQQPLGYLILYRKATFARFGLIEPRWEEIVKAIWTSSRKWGVSAEITAAKVEHESQFNPMAVGAHGEFGLMQVNPTAWPQFDTKRGFDIWYNVDFGCMIFAGCMKAAKGNLREALRRYNGLGDLPDGMLPYADRVLSGRMMAN